MLLTPLKVTFEVAGGWASPALPLHLDAVLAYSLTQRGLDDLQDNPSVEALRALGEDLPLARHEQDGQWCWKASAIVPAGPVVNGTKFYTQRRDVGQQSQLIADGKIQQGRYRAGAALKPYEMQIDVVRGVHRNMLGYYPVEQPFEGGLLRLEAWCVGDKDQVEELLTDDRRPTHLGARRRSGLGRIVSVNIQEDAQAHERWKRRIRPWKLHEDDTPILAACKAPYWAAENKINAFMPASL